MGGWLARQFAGELVWLADELVSWLIGWLAGWMAGWAAGWLADKLLSGCPRCLAKKQRSTFLHKARLG